MRTHKTNARGLSDKNALLKLIIKQTYQQPC